MHLTTARRLECWSCLEAVVSPGRPKRDSLRADYTSARQISGEPPLVVGVGKPQGGQIHRSDSFYKTDARLEITSIRS